MKSGSLRFWMVAPLMLAAALLLQAHSRDEVFPPRQLLKFFPAQIDGWTGTDETLDQETLDILGPGDFLVRNYVRDSENASDPQPWINLYIAYFPSQKAGDTIHSPNHCLPGAGWVPTSREMVRIARPDGSLFPVNRYVVAKSGERQLVLYWFQAHGRAVASEYWAKYYLIPIRFHESQRRRTGAPDDPNVRRRVSRCRPGPHDEAWVAQLPLLDNYIPR